MRQGMLVIAPDAETVLLGSGPCQGRLVAVRKSSNGWDGIDEEDAFFSSVPLLEEDVRQYTINVPVIVDMLRRQNDIDGRGCTEQYGLIAVGRRRVDGIGDIEVYLSLANYDTGRFTARCQQLRVLPGIAKVVLLVPRAVPLPPTVQSAIDTAGVVVIPLWPVSQEGSLSVDWSVLAVAESIQHTVVAPRKIIFRGRTYLCDLTATETAFLALCLDVDEIDVHKVMHTRGSAVIKARYQNASKQRNRVHQLLTRVNAKLADASVPVTFSLPRRRDTIIRESHALPSGPSLTDP